MQSSMTDRDFAQLLERISSCRTCAASLPHEPRPVVQAASGARLLIIGQAPRSKVHASGVPWDDDSGDLPPRPECAPHWHWELRAQLPDVRLTLLVGQYAIARHLPAHLRPSLTEAVRSCAAGPAAAFPLPHPSWRSRMWMAKNPWFVEEALPELQAKVGAAQVLP